jgi:AraC-like DNA-binding protein
MAQQNRHIERVSHTSGLGRWESAVALPHPALRPFVREYIGGSESTPLPLVRRELPSEIAPVIFNFGERFRIYDHADRSRYVDYGSFATGAFDRCVLVGSTGSYACVQVNFTILGARLFLAVPLGGLANRVVGLEDVMSCDGRRLVEDLGSTDDWARRFDRLDAEIMRRFAAARLATPIRIAVQRLVCRRGQVAIGALAAEIGWSHRHFVKQFTDEIGLTPKVLARVLRFGGAAARLADAAGGHLADIAAQCGYYDQAHFTRDFREFAGVTPTELLASRLPNRGGFVVAESK